MSKEKKRFGGRLLVFAVVLVIVALLVLFGTQFGGGSLRRIVYMIGSGVSGSAEEATIQFDANDANRFHAFSGGFAVLSTDGLHIYNMSGKQKSFTSLSYHSPSLSGSKKTLAAYDRNGKSFTILDADKVLFQKDTDASIINLSMNPKGAFSVVTAGPDCKSLVTVYDSSQKELYKLHSSTQYIIAAPVSNDTDHMATLSFSAASGQFAGSVAFYELSEEKPIATVALTNCMPISASFDSGDNLCVLCEDRIIFFNDKGEKKSEHLFSGLNIANASLASQKIASVLLDAHSVGGYSKLLIFRNGEEKKTINFSEDVFSVSSAGNYTAVTFANHITVYDADGAEYHKFPLAQSARSCIMRDDGTVLAIGNNYASLLIS